MLNTKLYLKDYGFLDLSNDIDIPLNFSLSDVRDITKKTSSYSKTIIIPGTKNNNILLGNLFEININFSDADFQINRKVDAIIYQNDTPIFFGYFKLLAVNKISPSDISFDQNIQYEAIVFSIQTGIYDIIKDLEIETLDFSQYDHILSLSGITGSSLNTYHNGYKYIHHYTSDISYNVSDFRPSIYLKTIWDKIFQNAGYTYTSTFLNSEPFTKLLIPSNVKDLLISTEEKESRECRVSFTPSASTSIRTFSATTNSGDRNNVNSSICRSNLTLNYQPTSCGNGNILNSQTLKFNDDSTGVNYDGSRNNYNTTSFRYVCKRTGQYEFKLNLAGIFQVITPVNIYFDPKAPYFALNPGIPLNTRNAGSPAITITAQIKKSVFFTPITLVASPSKYYILPMSPIIPGYSGFSAGTTTINFEFDIDPITIDLQENQEVEIFLNILTDATVMKSVVDNKLQNHTYVCRFNDYNENNTFLEVKSVRNNIRSGDLISMSDLLPKKIKQVDFIKSIANAFNLYIDYDRDDDKNLIIEPRDDYYGNFSNEYLDWSDKIDYSQPYSVKLLSELQNKTINFTYKQSKDIINTKYREQVGLDYGQYKLNFDNDFLTGEQKIELMFEPTPLVNTLLKIGDNNTSFIVPYLVYGQETPPKLLYDGGVIQTNPYQIFDTVRVFFGTIETSTGFTVTSYNYAGHFDNPYTPTFDLNWNVNEFYFYNDVLDDLTDNNLYNKYWANYINLISQSKLLTAYFNLNEVDIINLNLARRIWIRDSFWFINNITDYNASSNGLTKVELIKAVDFPVFKPKRVRKPIVLSENQSRKPWLYGNTDTTNGNFNPGNTNNTNYGELTTVTGRGNIVQRDVKNSTITGDYNSVESLSNSINIFGSNNVVGYSSSNIIIQGNNNIIPPLSTNISLINSNNITILPGVTNVSLTNVSNVIVTKSDVTYINEYNYYQNGYLINNTDIIDGGLDIVYQISPFYPQNLVDNGLDNVFVVGSRDVDLINGIVDGIITDNQQ